MYYISPLELHPAYQTASGNSFVFQCRSLQEVDDYYNMYDGCAFE